MTSKSEISAADRKRREEFRQRYLRELAKRPAISDEEFMAETEVSDEEYAIGLVLPGVGNQQGSKDG